MMHRPIDVAPLAHPQGYGDIASKPVAGYGKARKHNLPRISLISPLASTAAPQTTFMARDIQSRKVVREVIKAKYPKRVLGQGVFGYVSAVENVRVEPHTPPKSYAIKQNHSAYCFEDIKKEVRLACTIDHPRSVKYLGAALVRSDFGQQDITVVMELMAGTLSDLMPHIHTLTLAERLVLLRDIAEGLAHLHNKGLVHNDIKLDNILINDKGRACLGDLGRTQHHMGYCDNPSSKVAPEMLCFCALQQELAKTLAANHSPIFQQQLSSNSVEPMDTDDSGYTSDEPTVSTDDPQHSVEQQDGKTDVYALGYITMQLLLQRSKISVWDHNAQGQYSIIEPELAEYHALYADNPLALKILEQLIIPCLRLERDQRPTISEVIVTLNSLLANP